MTTRAVLLAAAAVALAVPAALPRDPVSVAASVIPPPLVADPFPIRRTFLTGERLAAVLADAARGNLARLPREEFEAKVRAASRHAADPSPRLAEACYKATLTDVGLTGSAEWRVAGSGLLALDPLRPAVSGPKWADGSPAAIVRAEPPGKIAGAFLVLDRTGDNTVSLNWSSRGAEEPGVERFDLAFPPAPVATLELDLPADRVPVVTSPDQLLTGPQAGPAADRRVWRVAFGGRPRVDLAVRRPHRPGEPGPMVRVNRSARYELAPGFASCAVELELAAVRGQPNELTLEVDPGLRVTGVTGPGRFGWRVEPGEPTRVVVTGTDPSAVGRVTVTGFAALPAAGAWTCPQVRLAGGLPGADAVEVRVDSELKFDGLDPGDYRVTSAGAAEGGYRVSLTGTLTPPGSNHADRRPPAVRVRAAGPEFATVEEVAWRVAAGRTDLTARLRVQATRGPLVQIPVEVSPGWTVESVRLVPDDPGVPPTQQPGSDGVLRIEPTRPVAAGQTVEVRLELRGPPAPSALDPADTGEGRASLPFPRVTAAGAGGRVGLFTLTVSPAFRAWPTPAPPADPTDRGAGFAYPFHGRPPDGTLTLAPRPPRVSVTSDTAVSLDAGELTAATTLTARGTDGEFGSLTVFTPTGPRVRWEVRADGATVEPLPGGAVLPAGGVLAATSPWSAAVGAAAAVPGSVWRMRYPRATAGPVEVTATARLTADPDGPVRLPWPTVLGAVNEPPRVTLAPSAAARYEPAGTTLRPRGVAAPPPEAGPGWAFDGVVLVTRVGADGPTCTFTGTVVAAAGPTLSVALPAGAEVTAVLVAGRHVVRPATVEGDGPRQVLVPLPAVGTGGTPFEVRYQLPTGDAVGLMRPAARLASPVPGLPSSPGEVALLWVVAPEFRRWPALDAPDLPATGGTDVTLVSGAAVTAVGWAAAAIVLGVGAALLARGRRRLPVLFAVGVAGLGAAAQLAPDGWHDLIVPSLVAGLLALAALVLAAARSGDQPDAGPEGKPPLPSTVTHAQAVAVLLAVLAAPSAAQAPEPAAVYVVPGPPADPGRLAVLAPQPVLDRLDALARPPVPLAAITAARYDGTAAAPDAPAAFTATYDVLVAGDAEQALALPLGGVRLEGVELDGKPAYPRTESQPDRYVLAVRGAGRHTVTAKFVVPPAAAGGDREVRFAAPDVPDCRVRFTAPAGATQLDATTRRGAQTAGVDDKRPRIDADHGGGRAVAVRWRDGSAAASSVTVAVREACVWDLAESGASVVAAFLYRIDGGSVSRLRVEFPDGLEPGRVTVRAGDGRPGPGLRDWQLGDGPAGWRSLTLGLQAPAEGRVAVVVRFAAQRPPEARTVLRFPRAAGVSQTEFSLAAVRLAGLATEDVVPAGVIDYPADVLGKEFATVPELGLDRAPADRVFQRAAGAAAEVRLALRPAGESNGGAAEVAWTVGPQADAEGVVRGGKAAAPVVEFDLPPAVRLDEVRAADLHAWGRSGSRVQVWLKKPARDAVVRWTGSLAGYPPKDAAAGLELPVPRVGDGPTTVRVRAAEGWAVVTEPAAGLKPVPDALVGEQAFAAGPGAVVRARVFAQDPPVAAEVLETVERSGDAVRYRAVVRVPLGGGRPHHFGLRLVGLPPGAETGVQGPEGVAVGRAEAAPDRAAWVVVAPPRAAGPLTFTLSATVPLAARLPRPAVTFGGPPLEWSDRALVADAALIATDGPPGWKPAGADRVRAAWPAEAARLAAGRAWAAGETPGSWAVAAAPPAEPPPAAVAGAPAAAPADPEPTGPVAPTAWAPAARATTAALGWMAALAAVLALAGWGGRDWWPEVLTGVGLLGLTAVAADSVPAAVFAAVAAVGVAGRVVWLARRLARVAMR